MRPVSQALGFGITMKYKDLSQEDFDAIVTGELTHYAIWFDGALGQIIMDYFKVNKERRSDFERLILHREGLTFQDKIEIVRAMLPLFGEKADTVGLKDLLKDIEEFKAQRNALAHGLSLNVDEHTKPIVRVEIISRSGKPKIIEITPESHKVKMDEADKILKGLDAARAILKKG
jgi:hypothetical protein